jgi:hypothetical protein
MSARMDLVEIDLVEAALVGYSLVEGFFKWRGAMPSSLAKDVCTTRTADLRSASWKYYKFNDLQGSYKPTRGRRSESFQRFP